MPGSIRQRRNLKIDDRPLKNMESCTCPLSTDLSRSSLPDSNYSEFLSWYSSLSFPPDAFRYNQAESPSTHWFRIANGLPSSEGGRGLISTKKIESGDCCLFVSLDDPCAMLTAERAVCFLNNCGCFRSYDFGLVELDPMNALILFLWHLRYLVKNINSSGPHCPLLSIWKPYLSILPVVYSDPVYLLRSLGLCWDDLVHRLEHLPGDLTVAIQHRLERLSNAWHHLRPLCFLTTQYNYSLARNSSSTYLDSDSSHQPGAQGFGQLGFDEDPDFLWAYAAVNSRCVSCPIGPRHVPCTSGSRILLIEAESRERCRLLKWAKWLRSTHPLQPPGKYITASSASSNHSLPPQSVMQKQAVLTSNMALVSSLPVLSLCSSGNLQTAAVPTTISLLPLFDLLNHDPSVSQPELCIEPTDPCRLRMITRAAYASGEQIFINYGSLDNLSLYTEYGFSLSCDVNPHDAAYPSYYELAHFAVSLPNGSAKIARLSWMLEQLDLSNPGTDSESCITMQILPDSKEPAKQVGFEDKDCFWSSVCFDSTGPSYFLNLLLYALTEEPLFVSTTCVKASSTSSNFVHLATKPKYVNDTPRSWLNSLDEEMIVRRTNHLAMKLANRLLQSVRCSQQNLSPGIISLVGKQTAAFVEADRSQHIARLRSHLEAQMRDGLTKWLEFREQLLLHSINSISTESKSHID